MTKHTTVLGDLLRHFSRSDFERHVLGLRANFKARTLFCFDMLKSMLYGQIAGCFSVREIEMSQKANISRLYHAGIKQPIKRSTFCDALEKRPHQIFMHTFNAMAEKAQGIAGRMKKKFNDPLRIIDATIISLCLARFDWAKYRKAKGAVKLHLGIDGDCCMPIDACLTFGNVHEVKKMSSLCHESGVIYVMDKGFVDYKSLYGIELQKSYFVTRVKSNMAYRRVHNNTHEGEDAILSDVIIELTGKAIKKKYPKPLRKVKYQDPKTKKVYEFLTNDMNRDAKEIAAIYKERWEVELFFKWMKQHLKVKSFWGTSMNAVYSQIWVALILAILIWINKTLNGIAASAHELLTMMKTTLLTKNSLIGLCTNTPPPKLANGLLQPLLEGFKC
jgi:hypothetical protein